MYGFKLALLSAGFVLALSVGSLAQAAETEGAACATTYGKAMFQGAVIDTVELSCPRHSQVAACVTSYGKAALEGGVIDTIEVSCPRQNQIDALAPTVERR